MRTMLVLAAILAIGCQKSEQVKADPSFADDVQPIFTASCVSCHNSTEHAGSYDLTSYSLAMGNGTDSIPNVIAGNADSSLLYRRITGAATPQMPIGGTPLDAMDEATIRNWINQGAKNN